MLSGRLGYVLNQQAPQPLACMLRCNGKIVQLEAVRSFGADKTGPERGDLAAAGGQAEQIGGQSIWPPECPAPAAELRQSLCHDFGGFV